MKPNLKVASATLAVTLLAGVGVQALADTVSRRALSGGKAVESTSASLLTPGRPSPHVKHVEGEAVFSEDDVQPSSLIHKTISKSHYPGANQFIGNIYGVCNNFPGMSSESDYARAFYGKINFSDFSATPLYSGLQFVNTGDQEHQTGAVRDGILYIPEGIRSSIRDFEVIWKRFDINTGKWLPSLACGDNLNLWVAAMTYDPQTDAFYGMTALEDAGQIRYGRLVRIDLNEESGMPEATMLRDIPANYPLAGGFFYNSGTREIMVVCDDYMLYTMNRTTGQFIKVGELYCDDVDDYARECFVSFEARGTQQIVFSPRDELAIWCIPSSYQNQSMVLLYSLDPDDGEMKYLGNIENGYYLTALYTPDTYAASDAADLVEITEFNLVDNALGGSVSLKAPNTLYNGLALTSDMTLVAEIDGNSIYNAKVSPAQSVNAPFTVSEGLHTFTTRADISAQKPGPVTTRKFYAGNDTPQAPTAVKAADATISWTAPGKEGQNFGYVDTSSITYDVYFNGVKNNTAPITATSYTFAQPEEMKRVDVTVTATYASKTSRPSEPLSLVIGKSLSLPYTATPEHEQADLFTIVDANKDDATFVYNSTVKKFIHNYENYETSNDWLILPALALNDASKMYEFGFDYESYTPYYGTENIDICLGKSTNVSSMEVLASHKNVLVADGKKLPLSATFSIPEAGVYYLAIHVRQPGAGSGSMISQFKVTQLNKTTSVPAKPSNVTLRAADKGELFGLIDVVLPTTDAAGKALPSGQTLTANARNFDMDASHTGSATGTPGSTVTVSCPATNGFNSFLVSVSNGEGQGQEASVRGYIGIDTPQKTQNFKGYTTADNRRFVLSWDPVTEGVNGGYIDPENLKYQIWYNSQGVTWNRAGEPVKETTVEFDPGIEDLYRWKVSVFAQNSAGYTQAITNDHIVDDVLGIPNVLPVIEPFGLSGPAYRWNYKYDTPETENAYIRQILSDEVPYLGIGDATLDDGSGRLVTSYNPGNGQEAELYVPKFSTKNVKNPTFEMKIWNYKNAPRFQVLARKFGQETPVVIAEADVDQSNLNSWRDYLLELPEEYLDEEWVQLRVHFWIPRGNNSYGLIDEINIFSNVDNDAKVTSIAGITETHVGDNRIVSVNVVNGGRETMSCNGKVEVLGDGKVLDTYDFVVSRVRPLRSNVKRITLNAKAEYLKYDKIEVRATTMLEDDEVPTNDSKTLEWNVVAPTVPVISDLTIWKNQDNRPQLGWSAPKMAFGWYDEMEYLQPFEYGEQIGQWKTYNGDNFLPWTVDGFQDRWPDCDKPRAWQVVNDNVIGTHNDSRLGAHSGSQYLIAFTGYDPDEPERDKQCAKWLISPEVKGGTEVKFWVNTPDPTYQETIHVMYSTTDDKPESFVKLCNRSKSGDDSWEQTSFTLPFNAKYFAFKYVGYSSTFGFLVDDIQFEPANPTYWDIEGYNIYRRTKDETSFVRIYTEPTHTGFIDKTLAAEEADYYIVASATINNMHTDGPISNVVHFSQTGVSILEALTGVKGEKGMIAFSGLNGAKAEIFTTDGKRVAAPSISSDNYRLPMAAGVYMVMANGKSCKVLVK